MFETLTEKLNQLFTQLRKRGKLSEADVDAALREVRMALLEADVYFGVVKDFIARLRTRVVGVEVSKALNPAQQVIKIVNEELIAMLGESVLLNLTGEKPRAIMLLGLQGSGKTTTAGKLANHLRSRGERVFLVAADPYRPAAIEQLQVLGRQIDVPVYSEPGKEPPEVVQHALEKARNGGYGVLIIDTAGRSQLDEPMMAELKAIAGMAMEKYGFKPRFPEPVLQEVNALNDKARSYQAKTTKDLSSLLWSSIDNIDSMDLDQLEYCERGQGGEIKVMVAVADVDIYVPKKSRADGYAAHNGTSVYTGIVTFPMLPDRLSKNISSLLQ